MTSPAIEPMTPKSAFCEKRLKNLTARRAERAQRPDFRPPLHDGDRHGVIDEVHAHEHGDVGKRGQIQLEAAQHAFDFARSHGRLDRARPCRNDLANRGDRCGQLRGIDDQIDAIEAADLLEEFLRGCDIDEDDRRIDTGYGFRNDRRNA